MISHDSQISVERSKPSVFSLYREVWSMEWALSIWRDCSHCRVKGSSSYKTIPRCWVKIWVFSSGGQETHSYFLYPNRCSDVCLLDPMNHVSYVHIKVPVLMEVGCLNVWFSTLRRSLPLQELSSVVVADNSLEPNKCSNLCLPRVIL